MLHRAQDENNPGEEARQHNNSQPYGLPAGWQGVAQGLKERHRIRAKAHPLTCHKSKDTPGEPGEDNRGNPKKCEKPPEHQEHRDQRMM